MRWGTSASRGRHVAAIARAAVLACLLAPLGACAALDWFNRDDVAPDVPAEKLYNEGVFNLNEKKDFSEAAKKFEEVDRQHPYSEYARKSLIMSAYSFYEARKYEDSINAAKRYISLHPGSAEAPYAQYLIGSSYYDQIPDVTRDQTRTERAIAALEEVVRKYPNTEYAGAAKRKIEMARDQLAGKEMMVGRYYEERKDFTGAINRFKVVVTQYQTTRHVEEALLRLTECYMALGIVQEAQTAAAVLGHNFPDSQWYKDAYALLQSGGAAPHEDSGSWISQTWKKTVSSVAG